MLYGIKYLYTFTTDKRELKVILRVWFFDLIWESLMAGLKQSPWYWCSCCNDSRGGRHLNGFKLSWF